jgi:hypothetical protein
VHKIPQAHDAVSYNFKTLKKETLNFENQQFKPFNAAYKLRKLSDSEIQLKLVS